MGVQISLYIPAFNSFGMYQKWSCCCPIIFAATVQSPLLLPNHVYNPEPPKLSVPFYTYSLTYICTSRQGRGKIIKAGSFYWHPNSIRIVSSAIFQARGLPFKENFQVVQIEMWIHTLREADTIFEFTRAKL